MLVFLICRKAQLTLKELSRGEDCFSLYIKLEYSLTKRCVISTRFLTPDI